MGLDAVAAPFPPPVALEVEPEDEEVNTCNPRARQLCAVGLQCSVDRKVHVHLSDLQDNTDKKLSYCWETVRHESMQRIAEMDVEMTT